jgi:hypothetical protein
MKKYIFLLTLSSLSAMEKKPSTTQASVIMPCTPSFSTDVLTLHARLEQTPAYKQYQAAKGEYERFGDSHSIQVVKFCKEELANSPEYQNWIKAVEKEKHVVVQMQQERNKLQQRTQGYDITTQKPNKSERWCWFIDENIKKPESKVAVIYFGK